MRVGATSEPTNYEIATPAQSASHPEPLKATQLEIMASLCFKFGISANLWLNQGFLKAISLTEE